MRRPSMAMVLQRCTSPVTTNVNHSDNITMNTTIIIIVEASITPKVLHVLLAIAEAEEAEAEAEAG
jgi:hypothetical protein